MAKIYRISDRIRVKIEGLEFILGPLTFDQKSEIQALAASGEFEKSLQSAKLAVKYGLKDVHGLEDANGNNYELQTDEAGVSNDSLNEILNLTQNEKIQMACLGLLQGVPSQFTNPFTGEKLEGVSIVKENRSKKK